MVSNIINKASSMHDGTFHGWRVVFVVCGILHISSYVKSMYLAISQPHDGLHFLGFDHASPCALFVAEESQPKLGYYMFQIDLKRAGLSAKRSRLSPKQS